MVIDGSFHLACKDRKCYPNLQMNAALLDFLAKGMHFFCRHNLNICIRRKGCHWMNFPIVETPQMTPVILWKSGTVCLYSLHPSVIILTFLFRFYFIRGKHFVTGGFLYIYTIHKDRKTENGKCVCTSVASRVHTVGWVSSDIVL